MDDDARIHHLLSRLLRERGFRTVHALSIRDLIGVAEEHMPRAFVLDLHLKAAQSGLEVLAWLRLQPQFQATPVLILTGLPTVPEDDLYFIRKNNAAVVYKADSLNDVADRLSVMLGGEDDPRKSTQG